MAAAPRWEMTELYSNWDGRVQFLELRALADDQHRLSGHTIAVVTSRGAIIRSITLTSDVPEGTAGKRLLIGTTTFAAFGFVRPDYVIPDGFFPDRSFHIRFADGIDTWEPFFPWTGYFTYGGAVSVNRADTAYPDLNLSSPTNFAGETAAITCEHVHGIGERLPPCQLYNAPVVVPSVPTPTPTPTPSPTPPPTPSPAFPTVAPPARPTVLNAQGIWWGAPAGSENGWGVSISQQGARMFVTWFTYDHEGSPLWLFMDDVRSVGTNHYFGRLYRSRGAPFTAYDRRRFSAEPVGAATLHFSTSGEGTFTYTLDGVSERKAITKFVFGNPIPTCVTGAGAGGNTTSYQDLWWTPGGEESGWGVNIAHQGNTLFATWFTYGDDGEPLWLMIDNAVRGEDGAFAGTVYRTRGSPFNAYDAKRYEASAVGSATFRFGDRDNGLFTYSVNAVVQSKAITRYAFATPATTCHF